MLEREKIVIGENFQSKMECFECFEGLIREETFVLIDEKTEKVPLNKANELLRKDSIYVYVIDELAEKGNQAKHTFIKDGEIFIRDIADIDDSSEEFICNFFYAEYIFLFKEEKNIYQFLGLYTLIETNFDHDFKVWEKQDEDIILLNEINLKELIENLNHSYVEKYLEDREKLKKLLRERGDTFEYLPKSLRDDEELCLIALENSHGCIVQYAGEKLLHDKNFAKKAIKKDSLCLKYFSDEIKDDFQIIKMARFGQRIPLC